MRYSISQVAKLSGVSSRTLRHYDAEGLLRPAHVGSTGYRWYDRDQLVRLQRILLLRRMGVGLAEIAEILSGQVDEVAALRLQRQHLIEEQERLGTIVGTIDKTITDLTGDHAMDPAEFFSGLHGARSDLRNRLVAVHGDAADQAFTAARTATETWDITDYEQAAADHRSLLGRMATLMRQGTSPDDPRASELVAEHHASMAEHWAPDMTAYAALADLYLDDDQQRGWIAAVDPALPEWLAAAMKSYAAGRLPGR